MGRYTKRLAGAAMFLAASWFAAETVHAQAPGEVTALGLPDPGTLSWIPVSGADDYNVYRGTIAGLRAGVPARCHGNEIVDRTFAVEADPAPGEVFVYLVSAESAGGEGPRGVDSTGADRPVLGACDTVVKNHVLDRIGFGWDEWTRDRIDALGLQGFLDEQLAPASIDETANTRLSERTATLEPPETVQELQALDLVRAVYSWRPLEQQVALFWSNHFNTDWQESNAFFFRYAADPVRRRIEATAFHYDELEQFRRIAFGGNFRQILGASAMSRAMLIYLDTNNSIKGKPNENYARELLELHTMGVDGGYGHHEIDEIARVMTGWNVCKKLPSDADDPVAPCIANGLIGTPDEPDGSWVVNFRANQHDCGMKMLFMGTPHERTIPDTCDSTEDGQVDVVLALDAIAAHPSTSRFLVKKLLRKFVTEDPPQAMIDDVVAVWNDPTNPAGVGDLTEVLRAVLMRPEFLDPDQLRDKAKTPFEHVASAFRATRGKTNGTSTVRNYLLRMGYLLHQNAVPTGFSEIGGDWIDTTGLLERQNFGLDMATRTGVNFGADVIPLLQENGISTGQGNAEPIVDFFIDALFGGALTPAERQEAIDYLTTDDDGAPANYTWARIRETVGFLLGYAQFQEQ